MLDNTTIFFIINMFSGIPYSLVSPLLPTLAQEQNFSETVLGFIISIFPLAVTLFSTVVPILSKKFSRFKLLSFVVFVESVMTILYGTLIFIPNKTILLIAVFIVRTIHGICAGIIGTLVYSLTISFEEIIILFAIPIKYLN